VSDTELLALLKEGRDLMLETEAENIRLREALYDSAEQMRRLGRADETTRPSR
jgi:hypothetical protein